MKKINGYWIDENNNKWDCNFYSEEKAIELSKTLIYCDNCFNCSYCSSCRYCHYCHYCDYCRDCSGCNDCNICHSCHHCSYCIGCHGYLDQPQIYVTKKIGRRNDNTTFYYGETKSGMFIQVVCGCFHGNLEKFEKAVLETHSNSEKYRNQYLKEIEKVKVLFDLKENEK